MESLISRASGGFEKSGVKLQDSTQWIKQVQGKWLLVRVVRRFEKLRVQEIRDKIAGFDWVKKIQRKRAFVRVIRSFKKMRVLEIEGKTAGFNRVIKIKAIQREFTFVLSCWEIWEIERSRNWDFTVSPEVNLGKKCEPNSTYMHVHCSSF